MTTTAPFGSSSMKFEAEPDPVTFRSSYVRGPIHRRLYPSATVYAPLGTPPNVAYRFPRPICWWEPFR